MEEEKTMYDPASREEVDALLEVHRDRDPHTLAHNYEKKYPAYDEDF